MRKVQLKINKNNNLEDLEITQKVSCKKRIRCIINVTQIVNKKDKRDKKGNRNRNKLKHKRKIDRKVHKHSKIARSKKDGVSSRDKSSVKKYKKPLELDKMCSEDRIIPRCSRCKCFVIKQKRCEFMKNKPKTIVKTLRSDKDIKLHKMFSEYRETERKRKEYQNVHRVHEDLTTFYTKYNPKNSDTSTSSDLDKDRNLADISLENITDDDDTILSGDMDISIHSEETLVLEPGSPSNIYTCSTPKLHELYSPISSAEGSPYFKQYNISNEWFFKNNCDENANNQPDVMNTNEKYLKGGQNPVVTTLFDEAYSPISSCDGDLNFTVNNSYSFENKEYITVKTEPASPHDTSLCFSPILNRNENHPNACVKLAHNEMSSQINGNDFIIKNEYLANIDKAIVIKKESFSADSNNNEDFSHLSKKNFTKKTTSELGTSCENLNLYNLENKIHIKVDPEKCEIKTEPLSPASLNGEEETNYLNSITAELSSNYTKPGEVNTCTVPTNNSQFNAFNVKQEKDNLHSL